MLNSMKDTQTQGGYSIVELLVSLGVFLIAVVVGISVILSVMYANKHAQGITSVMNNLSFALESMSRDLRTAKTLYCGQRAGGDGTSTRDCTGTGDITLSFTDEDGVARYYYLSGTTIMESVGGYGVNAAPLSGADVTVDSLQFRVIGSSPGDTIQPLVEILLHGHMSSDATKDFNIQMTVTKRQFDVP